MLEVEATLPKKRYGSGYRTGERFPIVESHQDAISRLPPGADLLAKSGNTPVEIWAYGDNVLAIQGDASLPFFPFGFFFSPLGVPRLYWLVCIRRFCVSALSVLACVQLVSLGWHYVRRYWVRTHTATWHLSGSCWGPHHAARFVSFCCILCLRSPSFIS